MSTKSANTTLWSDIKTLYSNLNTQRSRFSMSSITIPSSDATTIDTDEIETLNSTLVSMKSHEKLKDIDTSKLYVPEDATLLDYDPFDKINSVINAISAIEMNTSCYDFGFCSFDFCFSYVPVCSSDNSSVFYFGDKNDSYGGCAVGSAYVF